MHYICCHQYCVYDYPSSIPGLKPIKTAISSTRYVITTTLSKTSPLLCKASQVAYVFYYMHYTWHHIHTLWPQPLEFMTSHALYSLHHMHYIWHVIYCVWYHIHYMCDILYVWHPLYLWIHVNYIWHETQCVKTIQPLYMTSHSSCLCLCDHSHFINDKTLTLFLTSHLLYIWHNMHCIWHLNHDS